MPSCGSCTEDEVRRLVDDFYGRARADPLLGPIFEAHVDDWDLHLGKMVDFWSSALRGTARYRGLPMPIHVALPDLNVELFQRWLGLFDESTQVFASALARRRAEELARRIAHSLWVGYRKNHEVTGRLQRQAQ